MVGGTGLYIRTLMQGPTGAPTSTPESRALVEALVEEDQQNWETRWVRLDTRRTSAWTNASHPDLPSSCSLARMRALDPEYAATILPNDWYRLKRALEICSMSGRFVGNAPQSWYNN